MVEKKDEEMMMMRMKRFGREINETKSSVKTRGLNSAIM